MKKIIILLLVIAIIVVIPPYFIGKRVESNIQQFAAWTNSLPGYSVSVEQYQRDWFSAEAELHFSYDMLDDLSIPEATGTEAQNDLVRYLEQIKSGERITLDIDHGLFLTQPFGFGLAQLKASSSIDLRDSLISTEDNLPLNPIVAKVGISGNVYGRTSQPPLTMTQSFGALKQVSKFSGFEFDFHYTPDKNQLIYNATIPDAEVSQTLDASEPVFNNDVQVSLKDIRLTGDYMIGESDNALFWPSRLKISWQDYTVAGVNPDGSALIVNLGDWEIISETTVDENKNADMSMNMAFSDIEIPNLADLPMEKFSVGMALKQISPELQQSLSNMLPELVTSLYQVMLNTSPEDPEFPRTLQQEFSQQFAEVAEIFKRQPAGFGLNVALNLKDEESIQATSDFALVKPLDFSRIQHPTQLLPFITANVEATMTPNAITKLMRWQASQQMQQAIDAGYMTQEQADEALKEVDHQVEFMIAPYVQQGMIIKNDSGYAIEAGLQGGVLTVNGNEMPLPF